ncbi:response regulator [Marivita sp.]|jgi:CheY-like chemotaxis protein|uniref:response regulator n=1 Tax=Marivita sp. TaxID=2003365 RepID=UPI003F712F5F
MKNEPTATPDARAKRTVLVADDDAIVQAILSEILESMGSFEVTAVADTHSGIVEAVARPFDLLLFDRHMPPIQGDRAIRALRSGANPNRRAPIILMTAEIDHPRTGDPRRAEASLYFPKPLDPASLITHIHQLVPPH